MGDGVGLSWQVRDVLGVVGWVCAGRLVLWVAARQVVTVGVIEL